MYKVTLNNTKQLRQWLESKGYNYKVINDGWKISLSFKSGVDIFTAGMEFAQFAASAVNLVTIEELEQRGDIPGM